MSNNPQMVPPTKPTNNKGLVKAASGRWCAEWRVGENLKKRKRKSLKTKDVAMARRLRDRLFERLVKDGAYIGSGQFPMKFLRLKLNPNDPKPYVHHQRNYIVIINGRYLGSFKKQIEAMRFRNKKLGLPEPEETDEN